MSTLGSDANPGTKDSPKLTLTSIMGLSGLATGDRVNVVRDGIHRWPPHTVRAIAKPGVVGSDLGFGRGLLIRGVDRFDNPAPVVFKALSADGNVTRSLLAYEADTTGYYVFRNIIFDATEVTGHTASARCLFWDVPGNVSRPTKWEGCEVLGGPLGTIAGGQRWLIDGGGFSGSVTRLMSVVTGCYFQNVSSLGDFFGVHSQQWDHFVRYHDSTSSPASNNIAIGTGTAAITDLIQDFHSWTYYANGPTSLNPIFSAGIVATRPDIGTWSFYNTLFFHQRATSGNVGNPFMDNAIAEPTSIVVTRNIGGNVFLYGTNVTSFTNADGHYENLWDEDRDDTTGNDPWATDTFALNQYEADVFANPTKPYAWDPLGNGATILLPKDLRPIKYKTSGLAGATPGALPAFTPTSLDWLRVEPEVPVSEQWSWLSSVVTADNGSAEQRMALRMQPRRRVECEVFVTDENRRREEYRRIHDASVGRMNLPMYQYATNLTQTTLAGATKIFFNPARTDVRNDEYVVVFRPGTEESFLFQVTTVVSDGANLALPLGQDVRTTDVVVPTALAFLENGLGPDMRTVTGRLRLSFLIGETRPTFPRPGSTAVIATFDGLNVLDKRPVVDGDVPEKFDRNPTALDTETGVYEERVTWLHPFAAGVRRFHAVRPDDMDYWRDFLHAARGMREPFLAPTFREDFLLSATPSSSSSTIDVFTANYSTAYFVRDTYKRLRLEAPDGSVLYRKVTGVLVLTSTTQRLTLNTALPGTANWGVGFKVGYLNRVRLGNDVVNLLHETTRTQIELALRTTDT